MQSAGKCTSYRKKQFYTYQCLKLCWTADWHPFEICEVYSSALSTRPQSPLSTCNGSLHLLQYTSHVHVSYLPQINKLINSIYTVNQLFPNQLFKSICFQYQVLTTLFSKWLLLSVHLTKIMKQIFTKIQATLNVKFTLKLNWKTCSVPVTHCHAAAV